MPRAHSHPPPSPPMTFATALLQIVAVSRGEHSPGDSSHNHCKADAWIWVLAAPQYQITAGTQLIPLFPLLKTWRPTEKSLMREAQTVLLTSQDKRQPNLWSPKAPALTMLPGPCSPRSPHHQHGQRSPCLPLYSCWKWPPAQRAVSSLKPVEGCHVASRNFVLFYFGKRHSNIFTTSQCNGVTDGSWALAFMGKAPLSREAVSFPPNLLQPSDS